jgi:hypothetical protein
MKRSVCAAWGGLLVGCLLALAGCGDSAGSQVSGTVTVDGNPVEKGRIRFFPVDGKSQPAGGEIKGGAYSVKVPAGEMTVQISVPKVIGKKKLYDAPGAREIDIHGELLPPKYNEESQLKFDVQPGRNEKDWPLTTK